MVKNALIFLEKVGLEFGTVDIESTYFLNGQVPFINGDRESGEIKRQALSGVFVQIGLVPNSQFLEGVVERTQHGEVIIDERCQTNVPGIFAAGDVSTVPYKQIVIAMGEGAKASLSAFDYIIREAE